MILNEPSMRATAAVDVTAVTAVNASLRYDQYSFSQYNNNNNNIYYYYYYRL